MKPLPTLSCVAALLIFSAGNCLADEYWNGHAAGYKQGCEAGGGVYVENTKVCRRKVTVGRSEGSGVQFPPEGGTFSGGSTYHPIGVQNGGERHSGSIEYWNARLKADHNADTAFVGFRASEISDGSAVIYGNGLVLGGTGGLSPDEAYSVMEKQAKWGAAEALGKIYVGAIPKDGAPMELYSPVQDNGNALMLERVEVGDDFAKRALQGIVANPAAVAIFKK